MPKILLSILLIVMSSQHQKKNYLSYRNGRFDFCIEYPRDFRGGPPPTDGDGMIFNSTDSQAEIRAFGSLAGSDFEKLSQEYAISASDISITYKSLHKDWFIFTGKNGHGKIVYRKTVKKKINYLGASGAFVFQTLMITYPPSQASNYETYCVKISKSLN